MNWMNWIAPETDGLPLEHSFFEALKVYSDRLGVFALFVLGGLVFPVLALVAIHQPIYFSVGATIVVALLTLWLHHERPNRERVSYARSNLSTLRTQLQASFDTRTTTEPYLVELSNLYRYANEEHNFRDLQRLALVFGKLTLPLEEQLMKLGEIILGTPVRWKAELFDAENHFASEGIHFRLNPQDQRINDLIRETVQVLTGRHIGSHAYNRAPSLAAGIALSVGGLGFALEFISTSVVPPDRTSFWLAFYANPQATIERLEPGLGEIIRLNENRDYTQALLRNFSIPPWPPGHLYDFSNLASTIFLTSHERMYQFDELPLLKAFSMREWPPDSMQEWPSDLFLSNYLAWAFQSGRFERMHDAWLRLDVSKFNQLSPFIRILV